jgi:quercetin dioxygenase-like cupin family protein
VPRRAGGSGTYRRRDADTGCPNKTSTFEPGARTAWHTHPLGQTLIVTSGGRRAQRWGGGIEEIRPGDVVWFEALAWRNAYNGDDAYRHSGTP